MMGPVTDPKLFIALVIFTILLIVVYLRGHKRNMAIIRETADALEDILRPADKTYTWLGGVLGFRADFAVKGFREVQAVLTLLPRQSLLYLPVALLRRPGDRLQLLFYLVRRIDEEVHIIPRQERRPHIHNRDRLDSTVKNYRGEEVEILYQANTCMAEKILHTVEGNLENIRHIALTPEKSVFYIELNPSALSSRETEKLLLHIRAVLPDLL